MNRGVLGLWLLGGCANAVHYGGGTAEVTLTATGATGITGTFDLPVAEAEDFEASGADLTLDSPDACRSELRTGKVDGNRFLQVLGCGVLDLTGAATGACTDEVYVQLTVTNFEDDPENEAMLMFLGDGSSSFGASTALPAIADADASFPAGEIDAEVDLVVDCDTSAAGVPHDLHLEWAFEEVVYKERSGGGLPIYIP